MYQIPELLKIPQLVHAYSTSDEGNMANVVLGKEMDFIRVLKNRRKFLGNTGVDLDKTVCVWVEHGDKAVKADPQSSGISIKKWKYAVHCDAISTNRRNLFLFLLIADCLPVIFFDPKKEVVGLMHYGWKNADLNLAKIMVRHLNQEYGSLPGDLIVGFGPAVRKESYIKNNPSQVNNPEWDGFLERVGDSTYKVDVSALCKKQLLDNGIIERNIIDCRVDSAKDKRFFSRTRSLINGNEDKDRFACVVGMK